MAAFRWGIVSTGMISTDFTTALQLLPTTEHQIVGVVSRSYDVAKKFADRFKIPKVFTTYEEMAKEPSIDIVYIGSIHTLHCEISKMMLNAGKHVLSEKPMGVNIREIREMTALAKEKKLFLMEGFWSRFFPVYVKLREALSSGAIGEPRILHAQMGISRMEIERLVDPELGGGAMLDVGGYVVQMADLVFGGKPERISAVSSLHTTGVDKTTTITLVYPGGRVAVLTGSIECIMKNRVTIQGTEGIIEIPPNIWCPEEIIINDETFKFPVPECKAPLNFLNSQGFVYEIREVRDRILKGDLQSPIVSHESSQRIHEILTEARRQVGVVYPADKE